MADLFSAFSLVDDPTCRQPTGALPAPFQGETTAARHAGWTGAQHADVHRSANLARLRALWQQPLTINEMAHASGLPVSSVCSLRWALREELEHAGFVTIVRPEGRDTKRARWRIKS